MDLILIMCARARAFNSDAKMRNGVFDIKFQHHLKMNL